VQKALVCEKGELYTQSILHACVMKVIICTKYGPPEVLQIQEVAKPTPKDDEVLIKVHATTVSAADFRIRGLNVPPSFILPVKLTMGWNKPKHDILGTELSGEVEAVGKNVKKFKKGDKVIAYPGHNTFGAYTEYICMDENAPIAIKPKNVSFQEAAAIAFGGLTALHFLQLANLKNGQKILIYGASGAVGTSAVQLAKYFGAHVTAVCSTANVALVKSLGADKIIDYTKEDVTQSDVTYDVVFDTVSKVSFKSFLKLVKDRGVYMQTVATPDVIVQMMIAAKLNGKKLIGGTMIPTVENINLLRDLVEQGKFKPVIDKVYPFDEIVEAHRYVDKGHKKGNVVIRL
jgi:NADPH:quinone reductase-like Zn-dependent oxidoreductase